MKKWKTNSWRNYPVKHIPTYEDEKELNMVLGKLKNFPPLVFAGETRHLKEQLSNVVDGKLFYFKVEIALKVLQNLIQITLEIILRLCCKCL